MSASDVLKVAFDGNGFSSEAPAQSASLEDAIAAEAAAPESAEVESTEAEAPEAAPAESEASNQEADKYAKGFAALSRKEKAVREQKEALDKERQEFEARISEMEAKLSGYSQFDSKLKETPLQALQEKGVSLQDLVDMQLNDEQPTTEMQVRMLNDKIARMEEESRAKMEEFQNAQLEREKAEEEATYSKKIQDFKSSIEEFVNSKTEDYPLIKAMDSIPLVYDVIEQQHAETGRILSIDEASKHVETYLEAQISKYKGNAKIAKLLELQAASEGSTETKQPVKESVTLSNEQSATMPNQRVRKLSDEESLAEAAKLIRWDAE